MFDRTTTFWRATSSEKASDGPAQRPAAQSGLTRAQARALSRCEPLTSEEFRARSRMVDQGLSPLSSVLDEGADRRSR